MHVNRLNAALHHQGPVKVRHEASPPRARRPPRNIKALPPRTPIRKGNEKHYREGSGNKFNRSIKKLAKELRQAWPASRILAA